MKDIKSKEFENYLKELSQFAPVNNQEKMQLLKDLSTLKSIKENARKTYSPEEREQLSNWSYLLLTIDVLKDTLKTYDLIANKRVKFDTLTRYINVHQISDLRASQLFN